MLGGHRVRRSEVAQQGSLEVGEDEGQGDKWRQEKVFEVLVSV